MKGLIFKTTGAQGAMKTSLSRLKGVQVAFIYGSYAKGAEKEDSNINLMVVGQANITELNDMVMGLEEKLKRKEQRGGTTGLQEFMSSCAATLPCPCADSMINDERDQIKITETPIEF